MGAHFFFVAASRAMKSMRGAVRQRKVSFRKRCGKISVKEGARLEELGLVGAPRLNAPGGLSPAIPTVADYIHRLSVPSTLSAVGSPNSARKNKNHGGRCQTWSVRIVLFLAPENSFLLHTRNHTVAPVTNILSYFIPHKVAPVRRFEKTVYFIK